MKWPDANGHTSTISRQIDLDPALTGQDLRKTLLHEMCHAAVAAKFPEEIVMEAGHGWRFQRELRRLLRQGETWAKLELDICKVIARGRARLQRFYYSDPERGEAAQQQYLDKYLAIAQSGRLDEVDAMEREVRKARKWTKLLGGRTRRARVQEQTPEVPEYMLESARTQERAQ